MTFGLARMTTAILFRTNGFDHLAFVFKEGKKYIDYMMKRHYKWAQGIWRIKPLRHFIYWLGIFALYFIIIRLFESTRLALTIATALTVPGPFPVYLHFWVLKRLFEKRRYRLYIMATVFIIMASEPITQVVHHAVDPNPNSHTSGIGMALLYILVSTGFNYFSRGMRQQYRIQEAEHKQTITELALLKSQINPHFFFNTLNSLYALSLDQSDRVPEVILKLSALMRYVLDGSQKETVPLEEEAAFLRNYIDLETLRLNPGTVIEINLDGDFKGEGIAPMILAPFVENGFKHGIHASNNEGRMVLDLTMKSNQLHFVLENSKPNLPSPKTNGSHGLGLANVRRRLALLYPERHDLNIEESEQTYLVDLRITL